MTTDIKQFLPTFVEESIEMLQAAEKILLGLNLAAIEDESIHSLFRCMHTIKGSSAVFGFTIINMLSHAMETFLDQVRSGTRKLDQRDIDFMLKAIDALRNIILGLQNQTPVDEEAVKALASQFLIKKADATAPVANKTEPGQGWHIVFHPDKNCFLSGSEPARLFSALSELGKLEVVVNADHLPPFEMLNPEECFLEWQLDLQAQATRQEIQELLTWFGDEKNLTIYDMQKKSSQPAHVIAPQTSSVRVSTDRIDSLINMTGELVISQSVVKQIAKDFDVSQLDNLHEALDTVEMNSRELQKNIMQVRMVPIEFVFNRFPRMVHDIAAKLGKKVELTLSGEQTEIDRNMMEQIVDPLVHLVRNAIDHGIELPEARRAGGKSETAQIRLDARQEGGNILIDVSDDGRGLDREKILKKAMDAGLVPVDAALDDEQIDSLVFTPGFTTSEVVSDLSGRGVGLDVVYKNIQRLGGGVSIQSHIGKGAIFTLRLPLTLAIMDCQLVRISGQIYSIPLISICELVRLKPEDLAHIDKDAVLYRFRDNYVPVVFMNRIFVHPENTGESDGRFLIVVDISGQQVGLVVDELLSQQQVVIRNMEENCGKIRGVSGVTILGTGEIAYIVDLNALIEVSLKPAVMKHAMPSVVQNENRPFQFMNFSIMGLEYGIDILHVKEIRMWEKMTPLPNALPWVRGAINVRGTIIPIIDLCERFSLQKATYAENAAIITLVQKTASHQRSVGIIVDQLLDTFTVNLNEISPLPENTHSPLKHYIRGLVTVNGKIITVLNIQNLIEDSIEQEAAP